MNESLKIKNTSLIITQHAGEIEKYIREYNPPPIVTPEKYLENFLIENWKQTELSRLYEVLQEEGDIVGQQFQPVKGQYIDILAISKTKKEWLVIELKKGKAKGPDIDQIERYIVSVKEKIAQKDQQVKGLIIALSCDKRLQKT